MKPRVVRGFLLLLLLANLAFGCRHLLLAIVSFPKTVEWSLARGARGFERRWMPHRLEQVRYIEAVTPQDASVQFVTCDPTKLNRDGIPFSLFPRKVTVVSAPSPRLHPTCKAQGCTESCYPARVFGWRGMRHSEVIAVRGSWRLPWLVGVVVLLRGGEQGGIRRLRLLGHPAGEAVVPMIGNRAVFRHPIPMRRGLSVRLEPAGPPLEVGLGIAGKPLAWPILAGPHERVHRFRAGELLVLDGTKSQARKGGLPAGRPARGILALPLLVLLGLLALRRIPIEASWPFLIGLGWFVGAAIFAVFDFLLAWTGLSPRWRLILLAAALPMSLLGRPAWRVRRREPGSVGGKDLLRRLAIAAAASSVLVTAAIVIFFPREKYDSFAFWGMKSMAYYQDGQVTQGFLERPIPHQDYPFLGPVLEALIFRLAGGVCHGGAALLGPMTLLAAFLIIGFGSYGGTPRGIPCADLWSVLVAAGLAMTPRVVQEAGGSVMDIHVGGFVLAGLVLLDRIQWEASRNSRIAFLAGLMMGAAGFVKNDGMPWSVALLPVLVFLAMRSRSLRQAAAAVAGVTISLGPWLLFRFSHGLQTDIVNEKIAGALTVERLLHQIPQVLRGFLPYLTGFTSERLGPAYDAGYLFLAFGIAWLVLSRRNPPSLFVFCLGAVAMGCLYLSLPPRRLPAYLLATGFRIPLQFYLPGFYLAAAALSGTQAARASRESSPRA